jgi:hypothetical protein
MTTHKYLLMGVCALLISGCGSPDSAGESQPEPAAPAKKEEGVFDPLVGTLDRAKAVEDTGTNRKEEMDRRLEEVE